MLLFENHSSLTKGTFSLICKGFPYFYWGYDSNQSLWIEPKGIEVYLLEIIAQRLKLDEIVLLEAGQKWGTRDNDTNTWDGIVEMLLKNEADIGIGTMSITYDRYQVVDFTMPYLQDTLSFVTLKPELKYFNGAVLR